TLNGMIKSGSIGRVKYYFEYTIVDFYNSNITRLDVPNLNTYDVSQSIYWLTPSTEYKYRLIAVIDGNINSVSDWTHFRTCDVPQLYLLQNITINSETERFD